MRPARAIEASERRAEAPQQAAELLVRCLEEAGVEYVFGIPGGAVEPIYDAMARSARRGGLRPVVARHEAGAAFMADGYARETGKLGVCVTTSGPGATNLITGMACAYSNDVPLLAITGQPALPSFGRRALQESSCTGIDVVAMLGHCTRFSSLISHVDQLETKLTSAILHALRPPRGPSHLSIPVDIQRGAVQSVAPRWDLAALVQRRSSPIDEQALALLEAELEASARTVFLIGAGAEEAVEAIVTLVELTGARFITTPDAKGLVDPHHPAYRGVFGFAGHPSAHLLLQEAAVLVVAFGTGFGEFASGGWCPSLLNHRLIHVDESEQNLINSPQARLHVSGRLRAICDRLVARRRGPGRPASSPCDGSVTLLGTEKHRSFASPIKPQRLMRELSERCPPGTRFLADAGNSLMWAIHYLQPAGHIAHASWLRVALDFAPMGWAVGAAVGVARGNPRSPVVCLTGDGSYLMSGQEITTAAEERLPVIFVILNDQAYGMVMHGQRLAGAEPIAYRLPAVDFRAMARAMGIAGHVVEAPGDLDRIDLGELFASKGPALLDVRIDGEEVPPMSLRLKTLGSVKG